MERFSVDIALFSVDIALQKTNAERCKLFFYALARLASLQTSCQWNVCKCRCHNFIINHFLYPNLLMFFNLSVKDSG